MKSVSSIRSKYLRLNVKGLYTKLYEQISDVDRDFLFDNLSLLGDEKILVTYLADRDYWWVITNVRLIACEKGRQLAFRLNNIKQLELREIFGGSSSKEENSIIDLLVMDTPIKLKVETGTWHAIYNILKYVIGP